MKKSLCFIVFSLLIYNCVLSQQGHAIKGKVTDSTNGKPVAGCSVFINSTSRGTVTNARGEFELQNLPEGKYELIISSIGYETFVYDYVSSQLSLDLHVTLKQKTTELSEVTVESPKVIVGPTAKHAWPLWGKTFIENFIGKTPNAKDCFIKNPKVLQFRFSKKYNRLTVTANEPIIIENKALGYTIKYQLEEFYCDFQTRITLYVGYPLFTQMDGTEKKQKYWQEQRKKVYYGSVTHFMQSLYNGKVQQQGFQVIHDVKLPNVEKQRIQELYRTLIPAADTFEVRQDGSVKKMNTKTRFASDSIPYYETILSRPDFYNKLSPLTADSLVSVNNDGSKSIFFTGSLHIIYSNLKEKINTQSYIYLATPSPIDLEKNGGYYPSRELVLSGYWGINEKMSNTLPLDYTVDNN